MCILKEEEPKNRDSVIRPSEELSVGSGKWEVGSRQEGTVELWLRTCIRGRVRVLAPGPLQTHAVTLSKLKLPVSMPPSQPPPPIHCVSCKAPKLLGKSPRG